MFLNLPLDDCIDNKQDLVTREKRKTKETNKKETSTSDRKPKKNKEQDHLKKTSLGPLRQGERLDTSKTKPCSRKSANHQSKARKHKELPLHMCKLLLSQSTPP
jgi:hypothetical protein